MRFTSVITHFLITLSMLVNPCYSNIDTINEIIHYVTWCPSSTVNKLLFLVKELLTAIIIFSY